MLGTSLYWSGGREPEDWEDEWGDLPDEFQSPRLQVGDRLTFFVTDSEGSAEIVLRVDRVEFQITTRGVIARGDTSRSAIRDQHVWVSEAEPEDETADKAVDETVALTEPFDETQGYIRIGDEVMPRQADAKPQDG